METREKIKVETTLKVPVEKAWECFTEPQHITQWNFASVDWKCPEVDNDLRPGGKFNYRMEARDGSVGFNFKGRYLVVEEFQSIVYRIADERMVSVEFVQEGDETRVSEIFESENIHPAEEQRKGWQAILDHFKKHTEKVFESAGYGINT
ncbi:SRPBCC domain-containing protein [Maribellus mangrovi]|uniref:SRPBCC domain-containing protein n=1 Tax=Maribellus mangrovi TaxID=3133146 RepID=UPI0030ED3AA9